MFRVAGCHGPGPLKLTVPPETMTALPLTRVLLVRLAVPPLKVQVPPAFNAIAILAVPPLTVKLPGPEMAEPALKASVPLKFSVAPDAIVNGPVSVPLPLRVSVP